MVCWQCMSYFVGNPMIFPGLCAIFTALASLLTNGAFFQSMLSTLSLLIKSWIVMLAVIWICMILAIMNTAFRETLKSLSLTLQPSPTFVWLPVFMLIFGINEITVLILMVFSSLWFVSLTTMVSLEKSLAKWKPHCENLDLGLVTSLNKVYLPDMKPVLLSNLKTMWNMSWRTLLAIEVVFGSVGKHWGIGTYMVTAKDKMEISEMYAILFVILALGLAFNYVFERTVEILICKAYAIT